MTILNLMLGRSRGGLEQAVLDYAEALQLAGIGALTVVHPGGWAHTALAGTRLPHATLHQFGAWDLLAARRLKKLAAKAGTRAVICHGNRALSLALHGVSGIIPIVAVAHNYQTRRFARAEACFAVTRHAADALAAAGIPPARIFPMPNATRLPAPSARPAFRSPPVIGAMGRFDAKKGFIHYLEALALLKARGVRFRAVLGGGGEQEAALRSFVKAQGLEDTVTLPGWVTDKVRFFADIDLFVLPSLHESFGLVLLEAFAHQVPVVTTDPEGPRAIVHPGKDALRVPRADPDALAGALEKLLRDEARAQGLAANARALVEKEYCMDAMAARLKTALDAIDRQ